MTRAVFIDHLQREGACLDAQRWIALTPGTPAQLWRKCTKPSWLLWLAARTFNKKIVVLAACDCARTALKCVSAGEDRPLKAIEAAESWTRGEISIEQVQITRRDAAAYAAADAVAYAAARKKAKIECARLVHARIKFSDIAKALEAK